MALRWLNCWSSIAIIGLLVALLLPAVQAAREGGRRSACKNNIKQLALGVHAYHDVHKALPSLYNGPQELRRGVSFGIDTFSWQTMILPFIEEEALQKRLDFTRLATDPANQPGVNQLLPISTCPSTPRNTSIARGLWFGRGQFNETLTAATGDYASSEGFLDGALCVPGAWGEIDYGTGYTSFPRLIKVGFGDIVDGQSKTTLILERAGLPDHYFDSGRTVEPHDPPNYRTWGNVGLWAISAESLLNHLQTQEGVPIIGGDNLHGLYSFHPGGRARRIRRRIVAVPRGNHGHQNTICASHTQRRRSARRRRDRVNQTEMNRRKQRERREARAESLE